MATMPGEILDNRGQGEASWRWPPIHPEARLFAGISAALCVVTAFLAWETIAWPLGLLTICILAFFRDPARVTPQSDRVIIAPADGLVTLIQQVAPPRELMVPDGSGAPGLTDEAVTRISIFMSVFDVHVNRAPIGGTVRRGGLYPGQVRQRRSRQGERGERAPTRDDRSR